MLWITVQKQKLIGDSIEDFLNELLILCSEKIDKIQKNLLFPRFLYNSSTVYGGIAQLVEQ